MSTHTFPDGAPFLLLLGLTVHVSNLPLLVQPHTTHNRHPRLSDFQPSVKKKTCTRVGRILPTAIICTSSVSGCAASATAAARVVGATRDLESALAIWMCSWYSVFGSLANAVATPVDAAIVFFFFGASSFELFSSGSDASVLGLDTWRRVAHVTLVFVSSTAGAGAAKTGARACVVPYRVRVGSVKVSLDSIHRFNSLTLVLLYQHKYYFCVLFGIGLSMVPPPTLIATAALLQLGRESWPPTCLALLCTTSRAETISCAW